MDAHVVIVFPEKIDFSNFGSKPLYVKKDICGLATSHMCKSPDELHLSFPLTMKKSIVHRIITFYIHQASDESMCNIAATLV